MDGCDVFALILAILLCIAIVPNVFFDLKFYGWALTLAWIEKVFNLFASIFIMVGSCRSLRARNYISLIVILIVSDLIAIYNLIVISEKYYFNWPKAIDIALITPLIICCGCISKKRENMQMGAPIVGYYPPIVGYNPPMVVQNYPYPNNNEAALVRPSLPVSTNQPPS